MTENNAVILQDEFNLATLSAFGLPESFADALSALTSVGATPDSAAEVLADEWPLVEKDSLVNVPFLLVQWAVSNPESSENGQYIVARGMTKENKRFRISDGSTGICQQLVSLTLDRMKNGHPAPNSGLLCEKGLRKSDYKTTDSAGKPINATTFYVNNAL